MLSHKMFTYPEILVSFAVIHKMVYISQMTFIIDLFNGVFNLNLEVPKTEQPQAVLKEIL